MLRRLLVALLFVVCVPAAAQAWMGDTLTVIMKPLPNIPSFARAGDTLTVWANAPITATNFAASLRLASADYVLVPAGGGWQPSLARWVLGFRVPAGLPDELYDLVLVSDATAPDTSRHAVRVLPAYRADFYFAQVSDTHLPAHPFSSSGGFSTADTSGMADFDAVIADLNLIRPEFILHTGDLVNEGELEEYLGMYEMGRAMRMVQQLRDPIFIVPGNHDIGGWKPTPPPDGTARKNWWRQFGWSYLGNPPAGDPNHSQNYSFDYGLFHGVGMETYINNGSYDSYMTNLWGAQSFTSEQLSWLSANLAAVPAGRSKLLFYHYDFGGTNANGTPGPNFSQINPAALGLSGAIWGHNHGVAEGAPGARPFNLGLQAVIDGRRAFRIFRVSNGVISPGFMHKSGGSSSIPTDSLTASWSAANDGTRSLLTATVNNRFKETWDRARLVFEMANHDSTFIAIGGTIAQILRRGSVATVYVDCVLAQNAISVVTVRTDQPNVGVGGPAPTGLTLSAHPNPLARGAASLRIAFALPAPGPVRLEVYDVTVRRVATLLDADGLAASTHEARWDGRDERGRSAEAGIYLVRLAAMGRALTRRVLLLP